MSGEGVKQGVRFRYLKFSCLRLKCKSHCRKGHLKPWPIGYYLGDECAQND